MEWRGLLPKNKSINFPQNVRSLKVLNKEIISCTACPRLNSWRSTVAREKRKSYSDEKYWGKPVPSFGVDKAQLLIIGLAPGAHGANRTGRIFTGDRSGDWLYGSLFRNGLAKKATSTDIHDGQEIFHTRITCAVRCAPPDNKPLPDEACQCSPFLEREVELLLPTVRSFLVLGNFAWRALFKVIQNLDSVAFKEYLRPLPRFGHGAHYQFTMSDGVVRHVIGSYHPSQQNTFTGKLTEEALDDVVNRAKIFAIGSR